MIKKDILRLLLIGLFLGSIIPQATAQYIRELTLLHTNDMHSRVEPIDRKAADTYAGMGGLVRRATLVNQQREVCKDLLLFDSGDISQGTPYYNLFQGEVEIKMMNLMGYDAMTIGNHEFDFGIDNMARLFRMARFPIVSANYDVRGTVLEGLVKPYVVLERNGLKIGVFGLSPKLEGLVQADKCEGICYIDPITAARQTVDKLRNNEHCDVVICLSHIGMVGFAPTDMSDERLIAHTHGIDVVLGGHSHTFMQEPKNYLNDEGKNTILFHSGKNGIYVGQLKLTIEK